MKRLGIRLCTALAGFVLVLTGCSGPTGPEPTQTGGTIPVLTQSTAGQKYAELQRKHPAVNGMYQTGTSSFFVIVPAQERAAMSTIRDEGFLPRISEVGDRELRRTQQDVEKIDPAGRQITGVGVDLRNLRVNVRISTAASKGEVGKKVRALNHVNVQVSDEVETAAQ